MAITTITTLAAEDARLVVAFGNRLQTRNASNVRRNATQAEIVADLRRYMAQVVREEEAAAAIAAAQSGLPPDIAPT